MISEGRLTRLIKYTTGEPKDLIGKKKDSVDSSAGDEVFGNGGESP